jgi:hypothetical protein
MEELKHPVYYIHNKLRPNVVFNFVSVCKVSKINVKYVTCASAKRDDQNSVKLRVCFIRVYVFAFAATFNTVFCFFLANQVSFKDEFFPTAFLLTINFLCKSSLIQHLERHVKITFLKTWVDCINGILFFIV